MPRRIWQKAAGVTFLPLLGPRLLSWRALRLSTAVASNKVQLGSDKYFSDGWHKGKTEI